MAQPILHTERLRLVPLADRHLELEVELDADPEVMRYLTGRARSRDEVVASHARRMARAEPVDGLGYWTAFRSGGDQAFVGLMMLPPDPDRPEDPSVAELGYRLARSGWRQGLATEASFRLLQHAFETVGQSRVIARTMAVNTGSRGVMKALGLRHTRTFFGVWDDPLPGADQGEVEYEMTRDEWPHRLDH
jgi:RimJ/RimL family protein N-acetyltransferase